MNGPSYNAWRLVSLSPLPGWALSLLVLGIAAGVVLAAWSVRRESLVYRRVSLWVLRALAGLAALFFLLEPGVRDLQVARVKNRLALLIDRSASMGFPAEVGGPSRARQVSDFLEASKDELARLSETFKVEMYGFDPELTPLNVETLKKDPPRAGRTDILSALRALRASEQGGASKKLSGVLLFSDGADNVELGQDVSGRAKSTLTELGVPVSTFSVGKGGLRDLAVEQVKVDDFAFVRNSLTVEVEVRGRGFRGQEVPVTLTREGQVIANRPITLKTADEVQTVSFTFTPDQTGRFVYTVSVPTFPDEAVADNNTRSFVLKVIRDRIRVLLVVGRPSWDERFLRGLLRQDANVDLISFYILRTLADEREVRVQDRELSLIPFPTEEIFNTKLDTFDVVIFQNFGYTDPSLSISTYERKLERYIFKGGAFVMIGGDRSFGEGRATFNVLGQALPVEPTGAPATLDLFNARLTAEGMRHPVSAIGAGAAASEAAWAALPPIPGANTTRARPGATVLLEHPLQTADGKNLPIVALWDYGRGRSMAIATDASWYWAFTSHASGAPTRTFDRFWGNALRWLVRDPDLTTLNVSADPPTVEPGKPVGVIVSARLPDYQPAVGAEVKVELVSVKTTQVVGSLRGTTGQDGVVRLEFPPPEPGAYKLVGTAKKETQELGEGEDAVAVRAVGRELSDAAVRPDLMERIAELTQGKAFQLPMGSLPNVPLLDPPVVEVGRSKDRPLWDRWYYLLALVGLLGAEWMLRRRFGYL
ncbi:MAG: glutamine amidotransferase [Myxococcaceae bacterium]